MSEQPFSPQHPAKPAVHELSVQIVEYVDDCQPGIVRAEFVDSSGKRHSVIDKVPIFFVEYLDASSNYPTEGVVRCQELDRWHDSEGNELVRISTHNPDYVDTTEGLSEFVVRTAQLSPLVIPDRPAARLDRLLHRLP
jgi:hypothetical protein